MFVVFQRVFDWTSTLDDQEESGGRFGGRFYVPWDNNTLYWNAAVSYCKEHIRDQVHKILPKK